MNYYEFNLLITPNFTEEQVKDFNDSLVSKLKDVKIISKINSSQKQLSYLIEGEKSAWLSYFNATINEEKKKEIIDEIEKLLKEQEEILRYLILAKKELIEKPRRRVREVKDEPEKASTTKPTVEKANIEKVNEKVEELLKEE